MLIEPSLPSSIRLLTGIALPLTRHRPIAELPIYLSVNRPGKETKKAGLLPAFAESAQYATTIYSTSDSSPLLRKRLILSINSAQLVEMRRLELLTSAVQRRRSPN